MKPADIRFSQIPLTQFFGNKKLPWLLIFVAWRIKKHTQKSLRFMEFYKVATISMQYRADVNSSFIYVTFLFT